MFLALLSVGENGVRFFKSANCAFRIERFFKQGFRVPLAPMRGIKEITAVQMNCASQAGNRIGDRVDDVVSERRRIPRTECLCAGRLDPPRVVGPAAPEDIVLAPRIDADDRPHGMVVGHYGHHRRPYDVKYGQVVGLIECVETGALRLA